MEHTTFGDISPRTNFAAWGALLKRTSPGIITERLAQSKEMPKGKGRTLKFRRYARLSVATTPLLEGVTPSASKPTYTDVIVTVEQYGDWIGLTDVVEDTHEDPILQEFKGLQSKQMVETRETLNIAVLVGGSNVQYTNGTARTDVNTTVDRGDFRLATRTLDAGNAAFYSEILSGSPKYGTEPIPAARFALCHTDLKPDLKNVSGFVRTADYPEPQKAQMYEVGSVDEFRIFCTTMFSAWADGGGTTTTMISTTGTSADVYPIICLAPDAWATVPLRGKNSGNIAVVNPKPASGDPLGQRGTLGWKFWHAAVILNDDLMDRIETAATDTPT